MKVYFRKNKNKITLFFKGEIVNNNLKETPTPTEAETIVDLSDDVLYLTENGNLIAEIEKIIEK